MVITGFPGNPRFSDFPEIRDPEKYGFPDHPEKVTPKKVICRKAIFGLKIRGFPKNPPIFKKPPPSRQLSFGPPSANPP